MYQKFIKRTLVISAVTGLIAVILRNTTKYQSYPSHNSRHFGYDLLLTNRNIRYCSYDNQQNQKY